MKHNLCFGSQRLNKCLPLGRKLLVLEVSPDLLTDFGLRPSDWRLFTEI